MKAQQYFNKAKKFYDEGDYRKTLELCDYALTFNPLFIDALILKGRTCYQTGSYKDSVVWLRKAVNQKPNDKQLQMMLIDALLKAKQYERVINRVKSLLDTIPNDPELKFLYYYAHIKSRQDTLIGKVRDEIRTLIKQGYDDPRIYCIGAELDILRGDLLQAKTLLREHYTPNHIWRDTMLLLADAFLARSDFENVIELYNAVAEKVEDKKAVQNQLVDILMKSKQFSIAENILRELYKQCPDDTSVQKKFIECLITIKKFDDALSVIDAAVPNHSDNIELIRMKIDILIKKNDLDAALEFAQDFVKRFDASSPRYLEFKIKIAEILFLQGKYDTAKMHAHEVLQYYPKDAQARFILCKIKLLTSSSLALVGELRQLVNEYPDNAEYYYYLGLAHEKRQEEVMAQKAFREALEKDPGHRGALLALAEINFRVRSFNVVEKDIQNYFKIHPDDNETRQLLNSMRGQKPGST